jgi:hypothetical protein
VVWDGLLEEISNISPSDLGYDWRWKLCVRPWWM